jgi:hypothetical protein
MPPENSPHGVHIKICCDEKIEEILELTKLKQHLQVLQSGSQAQPVRGYDTPRPLRNAMNQREGQINYYPPLRIPTHIHHRRLDNLGTLSTRNRIVKKYKLYGGSTRFLEYNNHKCINHEMLSLSYTDIYRLRMLKKHKLLEVKKQLNDALDKFKHKKHMESQMELNSDEESVLITPCNEEVDLEEKNIDRRVIRFFVQVFIGAGVMIFCMVKIWQAMPLNGCIGGDTTLYFSLLSAMVGFYIPSPSMNKQ